MKLAAKWLVDNKEWVFSGIGVFLLSTIAAGIIALTRRKSRQPKMRVDQQQSLSAGSNISIIGNWNVVNQPPTDLSPEATCSFAPVGWQLIDSAFLESRRSNATDERILGYFDGRQPNWEEALSSAIPQREAVSEILRMLTRANNAQRPCVTLLTGASGEGKSTVLRQVVVRLIAEHPTMKVLWRNDLSANLPVAAPTDLPHEGPWLLVSDSAESVAKNVLQSVHALLEAGRSDVHFLLCTRGTDWNGARAPKPDRWKDKCDFAQKRLRGLTLADATALVSAWSSYGNTGLRHLADLPAYEAAQQLVRESECETNEDEGSLLGAMLRLRFGDGLEGHIATLIDQLDSFKQAEIDLVQAFAYIAVPHADGILTLGRPALAKVLCLNPVDIGPAVIEPLADEALIAESNTTVVTRHRAIADCVTRILSDRYGSGYLDDIYVELTKAHLDLWRLGESVLAPWNNVPRYIFSTGQKERAILLAETCVQYDQTDTSFRCRLSSLYRKSGRTQDAIHVLKDVPDSMTITREYCHQWALTLAQARYPHVGMVMAYCALSDGIGTRELTVDDAVRLLKSLANIARELHRQHNDISFHGPWSAAARLALKLPIDWHHQAAFQQLLGQAHRRNGVNEVDSEWISYYFWKGLNMAWTQMESNPPDFVHQPSEMTFASLTRLTGVNVVTQPK